MEVIQLQEKKRIYFFEEGQTVVLEDTTELVINESGSHRVKTVDGSLHIIPNRWEHILVDGKEWTA